MHYAIHLLSAGVYFKRTERATILLEMLAREDLITVNARHAPCNSNKAQSSCIQKFQYSGRLSAVGSSMNQLNKTVIIRKNYMEG